MFELSFVTFSVYFQYGVWLHIDIYYKKKEKKANISQN